MSQNFEELYTKLKEEFELSKKDNDEICKEYESTIEMLTESVESFKKEKISLEQKLSKYEIDFKNIKKEKESLSSKNKDKISDIQNLTKQNDRLTNEVKRLKEEKALFDSKIVSLENDNEHCQNKIREYEALAEDLEKQLESALEENITLQTEFETYKQTTGEQLIRKEDEIRDIKNDLLNKDKFIKRFKAREKFGNIMERIHKDIVDNKTKEKRRFTVFQGLTKEENDLMKLQKNNKGNLFYNSSSENIKNNNNSNNNKINSVQTDNKSRNSMFMSGFGSLSRLNNKKEELNKNINKNSNNSQKKENNYNNNKILQKNFFTDKKQMSQQIDEISESSDKEEIKENKTIKKINLEISKESQVEYKNNNVNKNNKENELIKLSDKTKIEKGIIIDDLQKMLDRIRKRKEKLVNTKKTNKQRIKNLKEN